MKCAHILSSRISITPFKIFNPKPLIMSAISRKNPWSSHSIYKTIKLVLVSQLSEEFLCLYLLCFLPSHTSISIWPGGFRSSTITGQPMVWSPNSNAHVAPPESPPLWSFSGAPLSGPISYRIMQMCQVRLNGDL